LVYEDTWEEYQVYQESVRLAKWILAIEVDDTKILEFVSKTETKKKELKKSDTSKKKEPPNLFRIYLTPKRLKIVRKMYQKPKRLRNYATIHRGIQLSTPHTGKISDQYLTNLGENDLPFHEPENIKKWYKTPTFKGLPGIKLPTGGLDLDKTKVGVGGGTSDPKIYNETKVIYQRNRGRPRDKDYRDRFVGVVDEDKHWVGPNLGTINLLSDFNNKDNEYLIWALMGILSSELSNFFLRNSFYGVLITPTALRTFPLPSLVEINNSNIAQLAKEVQALNKCTKMKEDPLLFPKFYPSVELQSSRLIVGKPPDVTLIEKLEKNIKEIIISDSGGAITLVSEKAVDVLVWYLKALSIMGNKIEDILKLPFIDGESCLELVYEEIRFLLEEEDTPIEDLLKEKLKNLDNCVFSLYDIEESDQNWIYKEWPNPKEDIVEEDEENI